jgi:hypothetical protein
MSLSCCFHDDACLKCGSKRKTPDEDDPDQHPASWIVVAWQKDYSKGWKWNNAHRHLSKDPRVPLWDDASCLFAFARRPKIPWIIPLSFEGDERRSIYRIRIIRYNMRIAELDRKKRKHTWWILNVENKRGYFKEYEQYISERTVPGLWLSLAIDNGLTFRHLRNNGYRPYIDLACSLEDETDEIDRRVLIASRKFPKVPPAVYRPYIFME